MQKHAAAIIGLEDDNNCALSADIMSLTGLGALLYSQPQLAGGAISTPRIYAGFLRKILGGELKILDLLGTNAVCTSKTVCPDQAVYSPFPAAEAPQYSLGHWVEDSSASDGAFSSPGAFGFYPWIDSTKTYYGILAREVHDGVLATEEAKRPYLQSMSYGRLIRKAWKTGYAITDK